MNVQSIRPYLILGASNVFVETSNQCIKVTDALVHLRRRVPVKLCTGSTKTTSRNVALEYDLCARSIGVQARLLCGFTTQTNHEEKWTFVKALGERRLDKNTERERIYPIIEYLIRLFRHPWFMRV